MNALAIASPLYLKTRSILSSPLFWLSLALIALLFFGAMDSAHAADTTGGGGAGLPWEGPLDKLKKSISGPVAFVIALLGIIACGATLIWGGEVSEFTRRIIYVVLVVCLIVFANTLLTGALFSGATIPEGVTLTFPEVSGAVSNMISAGAGGQ
ncbi:TrbC/VirB2 family protein [Rhizobium sp. LCM 4573]|uniref:TrbC/VirB2 family protein n=1 Tax=Rhizobium sp. LCM 4573 TaxID=1848291 RepID=UPI0008DA93E3|nr:TrbC/VirB2 family protein [Rhizobium sp. LCM 4573]OHV78543.1 conjugal transfer protein TrbC [Rhizobium sp. LCM 4573]